MSKSEDYTNGTYIAFGIAIGYASNFLPEQNLWALTVGLSAAAVAYFLVAHHEHRLNRNNGLQIAALALAAIAPLTLRAFSAVWALVFVGLGCVGTILNHRRHLLVEIGRTEIRRPIRTAIRSGVRSLARILRDLAFVAIGAVVLYELYNTPLPVLGWGIRNRVGLGTLEVLTGLAAIAIALYAYRTVHEMTKDRRKDTVEKMLESLYSPLYEILRKAKFENDERGKARNLPGFDWSVRDEELARMRETIEKFGHYLDPDEAAKLGKLLENPRRTRIVSFWFNGFSEEHMSEHFQYVMNQRRKLMEELRELTKPP